MLAVAVGHSTSAIPGWMPFLGGIAGSLKYLLLSVLTPLYGVTAVIRSAVKHQEPFAAGEVAVNLVAVSLLVFNSYRLVSDVIPCLV